VRVRVRVLSLEFMLSFGFGYYPTDADSAEYLGSYLRVFEVYKRL